MVDLLKNTYKDWRIVYKDNDVDYCELLKKFYFGYFDDVKKQLNSSNVHRSIFVVEINKKQYIIKHDREIEKRFEKKLLSVLLGTQFLRLIKYSTKAIKKGCKVVPEIYLVAEKISRGCCKEAWIIAEYVQGRTLEYVPNTFTKKMMLYAVTQLHKYGLASNDIHSGNFILSCNKKSSLNVSIIDLKLNDFMFICRANDIIKMRKLYDIKIKPSSFIQQIFITISLFRSRIREYYKNKMI